MSLQIWLPLNGDLENNGLADITVTNSGATVDDSGKIGKCYSFDGSNYIDTGYIESFGTGDFSISCWIYLTQVSGKTYQCIIGNKSTGAASVGISLYYNQNQKKFLWSTADGTSATEIWSVDTFDTVIFNQWHHIVMVRNSSDAKKGYFYFDGVRKEIASVPAIRNVTSTVSLKIGSVTPTYAAYFYTGKINDVRIYDHALSVKEVKELSRALTLHYKLDNSGFGQPNLISDSVYESDPWKSAILETLDLDGKAAKRVSHNTLYTKTSNGTTELFPGMTYEANTQYTISVDWRDDYRTDNKVSSMYLRFEYSDGTFSNLISGDMRDKHYWTHAKLISTAGKTVVRIRTTYGNGGSMYIANLKLEKGAVDTGYAPYDDIPVYDCSGYENDGTITGTLSITSDTKRYNKATYFNGSSYILTPSGSFSWFDFKQCTIALWMKPTTTPSGYSGSFGITHNSTDGYYSKCFSITNGSGKFKINAAKGSGWIFIDTGKNATVNEWHHYAITLNDSAVKAYLDGELIYTTTIDWNTAYVASDTRVNVAVDLPGSDETFTGYFSDARIYTTALSDTDILELYNTMASTDRAGNLYAREVVEE